MIRAFLDIYCAASISCKSPTIFVGSLFGVLWFIKSFALFNAKPLIHKLAMLAGAAEYTNCI